MRKSLIDSIGRENAFKLMEDAVLRAIDENYSFGLVRKAKSVQVVRGVLHVIEGHRQVPLIAGQVEPSTHESLIKQVPIA